MAKKSNPSTLLEFFKGQAENIEALGVIDNNEVYTSEDYVELVKLKDQAQKNGIELGNHARVPQTDNQGMLLRTPRQELVVNPAIAFANRVRVNKDDKTISIVIDYRAVEEQKTGMLYATAVVAYRIGKIKDGNYAVQVVENIPEQAFLNEFTDSLNEEDAKLMLEVITHYQTTGTSAGLDLDSLFS